MTALVLDLGAFRALDRRERLMIDFLNSAHRHGLDLRTSAAVVGQIWRDPQGRQKEIAELMDAVEVVPLSHEMARDAGLLLGRTRLVDIVKAALVLIADPGDRIVTEEPAEMNRLVRAANKPVAVVTTSRGWSHD